MKVEHTKKDHSEMEPSRSSTGSRRSLPKGKRLFFCIGTLVILILVIGIAMALKTETHRTESYKKSSGVAGLSATISYDCPKNCKEKSGYNVYILREDGQQVSTVQPDSKGGVHLALPEGTYIMLIGREAGKHKLFPQERVELKNGQQLDLKLQYKGVDK